MKTTEDLLIALDEWLDAKADLKACYASCDSSPGYFCSGLAEREARARAVVAETMNSIIDARIAERIPEPKEGE